MTSSRPKVVFLAGPMYGHMAGPRYIAAAPPDVEAFLVDAALPNEEKINLCKDMQALMVLSEPVDFSFLKSCPNLKLVQSFSAGNDELDLKALAEMGIPVASNGGSNALSVAEHALALMLAVIRRLDDHVARYDLRPQMARGQAPSDGYRDHRQDRRYLGYGAHRQTHGQVAQGLRHRYYLL